MRRILILLAVFLGSGTVLSAQHARYVDPFIGTAGMGHTFPGACVPFGGVQLSPDSHVFLTAQTEDGVVGYIGMMYVLDEGYIGNVAVLPAFRRRGIADTLLHALDELAEERGLRFLTLEVRAGNMPARCLYEKNGYVPAGFRPGYYSAPKEDAVLMTKEFEHAE